MTYSILRGLRSCLLALVLGATSANALAAGYHTQAGKIYDANNQEIQIRGISHFGFNSKILVPQFLWQMGWKEQIAQIKSLGFNAIRVPFVPDTLYDTRIVSDDCPADLSRVYCTSINANLNPELIGKTPLEILDLWMAEAERQGLYVMLDFHSVSREDQNQTWWYNGSLYNGRPEFDSEGRRNLPYIYNGQPYTADNWRRDLTFVADRYKTLSHFIGIDLFNEPRDDVRWASGAASSDYYWKNAAESASQAVLAANPNLLIFVQGMTGNWDGIENSNIAMNWGENLQPEAYQPLNIPDDKLVLAPHTYGPDVYMKSSFGAANFPNNLAADWEALFGQFSSTHPVVVGEWGGRYGTGPTGQQDVVWQNAFVDYLNSKNIHSSFYWCYTPNSGDTGGILNDDLTVREDKMALLRRHWDTGTPPPTTVTENIYTDAPGTNWHVTGWNIDWSEQTNPVYQGTTSLLANYTGEWGGLIFERRDNTNTPVMIAPTDFNYVTFAVNPGATVSDNLNSVVVYLDNGSDSKPLINYLPGNAWVANQWQVVRIPIADLNSANTNYYRVIIHSQTQAINYGFSIDAVGLESGTAPPPASGGSGALQSCAGMMPLGDSITLGGNGGYRNDLYTGLLQNNCGIDYVGTLYDANTTVADKDHEGHPGYTIVDVAREVDTWLSAKQPNVILLMIGTNDTAWWTNEDGPEIAARHNALIDQLQAQRPNAWIFVATIPPQTSNMIHGKPDGNNQTTSVDRAVLTQDFNAVVRTNVQSRTTAGQKVRLVDVNSVLTTADLYDGIHPTDAGSAKIAAKFLEVVRAALNGT